ncbi:hypothetical protein ACFY5C_00165 [Streptomyces sp. NPDC012935]|uniref:hypothetical protein n=1 Tax=Streptomyces sp. NPDC012935 TaxID=3364857 RepID=UPI0036813474
MPDDRKQSREQPDTALEEALQEMSDAAHRTRDPDEERRRGEAGEDITPSRRAQEESEGE